MAKWGKGDPRWIVEERPDATNVNNWHWTEKNASGWSRNRLFELLIGMKIETDFGYCEITQILKCQGDAVVMNRRGKLLYFYEWNLEMKWIGVPSSGDAVVEGKIEVLNLTELDDLKDTVVLVSYNNDGSNEEYFGNIMEYQGEERILELLAVYVTELKEDFSKDLFLPSQYCPFSETSACSSVAKRISDRYKLSEQMNAENITEGKTETGDFHCTETFKCTAEELYRTLTVKELVQIFTQSDCVLDSREGGKFELFGGNVQGYFFKLLPVHTIMFKWRVSSWPENHYSDVVIVIDQKMDYTEVKLSQSGVPILEIENTREGWKRYYWDNIKRAFGFGAFLF